jgi:PadR family transcriptional regulator PadR
VRRKPGHLVPLELVILEAAIELRDRGEDAFHGYELAKVLRRVPHAPWVTAFGTLYRALSRLENMGLLDSRWEAHTIAARENRPRRRLYTVTAAGDAAIEDARRQAAHASRKRRRRVATA